MEPDKNSSKQLFQVNLVKNGWLFQHILKAVVFAENHEDAVERVMNSRCELLNKKRPADKGYRLDYAFTLSPSINAPSVIMWDKIKFTIF